MAMALLVWLSQLICRHEMIWSSEMDGRRLICIHCLKRTDRMIKLLILPIFFTHLIASSPVSIESRQVIGTAPATFRIRITLEPDARNRYLCLRWLSDSGAGHTSCWSVQAEKEAKTTWKDLRDLSAGTYEVLAYAIRSDEQTANSNTLTLEVR